MSTSGGVGGRESQDSLLPDLFGRVSTARTLAQSLLFLKRLTIE